MQKNLSSMRILMFFILCKSYEFSNFNLTPDFAVLNSTSISRFLCTKETDDGLDFGISLMPTISSDDLKIYEKHLNNTAMEITIQSSRYIGAFNLICSSIHDQSLGTRADVIIGTSPGLLTQMKPCIVYENKYIDCKIRAPTMVSAIHNQYPYYFDFIEIQQSSEEDAYNQPPELIKTDSVNETLTFRWIPVRSGIFPEGLNMLIQGTLRYFGSINSTLDMTPSFWIKPNFTVEVLSSTDFQVHFHSPSLLCHGNLTKDSLNQKETSRIFDETNQTTIYISRLTPNTWYRLCFQCHQHPSVNTISEIQCIKKQTKQALDWYTYSVGLIFGLIIIIIAYVILSRKHCIKKRIEKCKNSRNIGGLAFKKQYKTNEEIIELKPFKSERLQPFKPQLWLPSLTNNIIVEETKCIKESSV